MPLLFPYATRWIQASEQTYKSIQAWLVETINRDAYATQVENTWYDPTGAVILKVMFKTEADLSVFYLAWNDHVIRAR